MPIGTTHKIIIAVSSIVLSFIILPVSTSCALSIKMATTSSTNAAAVAKIRVLVYSDLGETSVGVYTIHSLLCLQM